MDLNDFLNDQSIIALVYGESGAGKTHLIGTLKGKTLLIASELMGLKTLRKLSPQNIELWCVPTDGDEMNKMFDELMLVAKDFDTICIDSISELDHLLLMSKNDISKNGGAPTLTSYGQTIAHMQRWLKMLTDIASINGTRVLLTAPAREYVEARDDSGEVIKSYPDMATTRMQAYLYATVDIVGHLEISSKSGDRFIRFQGNSKYAGKDRLFNRKFCVADAEVLFNGETGLEEKGE